MSEFGGNSDGSYEIAVAAAAYAIVLLEEERLLKQKKSDEEVIGPETKIISRGEEIVRKKTSRKVTRWLTRREEEEDERPSGTCMFSRLVNSQSKVILSTFAETKDSGDFVIIILVKLKSLCSIIRKPYQCGN